MRGMTGSLTIGERVAWYRRRRGMTQAVLAGLVARSVDWLGKVENNRIPVDRLSVITSLAEALDVTVSDLVAKPSLPGRGAGVGRTSVPVLRTALMNYRQVAQSLGPNLIDRPDLDGLNQRVADVWDAYQHSRYGFVTSRLPVLLAEAHSADHAYRDQQGHRAKTLLAQTYHAATTILTKLGEAELAWIAADRGLTAAQGSGNSLIIGSLLRAVIHSLVANGRYDEAVQLTSDAANYLRRGLAKASPEFLSVYGTLLLAGSMASARNEDRSTTKTLLTEADRIAGVLGHDGNHVWTAFGPTNVTIHRVSTAMELGDVQVAIQLGAAVNPSALPMERRIRHAIELARAYSAWNRRDEALTTLLNAEHQAPEHVRHHYISRQIVLSWIRQERGKPPQRLADLASRLNVA
jgi:transcriptional regulator with XRE-family HTH domain